MDKELMRNENGDFEMSDAQGTRTPDEELELSIFSDGRDFEGSGVASYSLCIKIGGTSFYGRELSAEELQHVTAENQEIAADSKALKSLKGLAAQQEAGEAIARRSVALALWVIEKSVTGWNNPKWAKPIPYTGENRQAMSKGALTRLSDDIVAKSYSGRAASDVAGNF